jgi:hypothetical protein
MGFLRKATFVATGGTSGLFIKANSKKERTAKALEAQVRLQKQALKQSQPPPPPNPKGPTFSNMARISFRLSDYDGGLPLYPKAVEAGEFMLVDERKWELHFKGVAQFFYGTLDRYSVTAAKLMLNSCRVTMIDKQNPSIKWQFNLPRTSATALAVEVAGRLAKPISETPKALETPAQMDSLPQTPARTPLHAARDPQGQFVLETPTPRTTAPPIGVADEIAKLGKLKESGLLTHEEFAAQKAKLLGM